MSLLGGWMLLELLLQQQQLRRRQAGAVRRRSGMEGLDDAGCGGESATVGQSIGFARRTWGRLLKASREQTARTQ